MQIFKRIISSKIFLTLAAIVVLLLLLSFDYSKPDPDKIVRGASFSKFHSDELKLDWKKVYLASLDELKVRDFRFSAHWPLTEPADDKYNFKELDFQMNEAKKRNASVILAVGRRLPGWPECHVPEWAKDLPKDKQQEKILEIIEVVVNRYKGYENIKYWQVENEPFLAFFSNMHCGDLDKEFLQKEIALVRKLDPSRKILVTDSGEFGTWANAYQAGDVFGTSQYLYIWNRKFDLTFRYPIGPWFFNMKKNLVKMILGTKPMIAIEVSSEPWLLQPIIEAPMEVLLDRMGIDKFNEMIALVNGSGFDQQYFWGLEWWYWMREHGHPEYWDRAKLLYENK
ncbi:MAG: hypothetical protein A2568_03425 [Candidatus Yanofskybacteria bacterium RIFOXYD1_FULL_44_17]|uniref:GH10 domain-containing protein n=1 Tax=Candidatus Yanofskybacteria bacterium GW2011_GWE2_40_11 TaxID=1619033 RepID=A0A0G0TS89_9BACT|nr:MAG: hypothetical protein UT75_C0005G0025 [Candidatus Yanofskybacteria bacterium GW2011_GWE2_40_11]OGN37423.1 MAG: hypothetical protein A2371_00455 [Candidatus Yanofskybacteria bacterium RIFOXYB1_FULL_44_29]OGN39622.1 MAG: hypothetical protein A2568_03425 [Candidatus Yanofskybacteria bacterium RIFOXYD1_FULL_44_17]HAU07808.1 hypothetical protein [Candidatus Yanofskybacteria bacterium]HBX58655.1 hypothetical protein [Candidatus Yanofskybacteria bacterium]